MNTSHNDRDADESFHEKVERELRLMERLLERGDAELEAIETRLFVEGEVDDSAVPVIERSSYSMARKEGEYTFCDDVDYVVLDTVEDVSVVKRSDIETLRLVDAGRCIAVRDMGENVNPGLALMAYTKEYQDKANITVALEGKDLKFTASISGKVVVVKSMLYVVRQYDNGFCQIEVTADEMAAIADFFPSRDGGDPLTVDKVKEKLAECGVTMGILEHAIAAAVKKCETSKTEQLREIVASGKQPIKGRDGSITFYFQKEKEESFQILPDGRIDYRKQANITNVKKNAVLAMAEPHTDGVDGMTVRGKTIAAAKGKAAVLIAGENVDLSPDGRTYTALSDGEVTINNFIINVFKQFQVNGDVDYKSGNIDFNGNVTVNGSVRSGFTVKATGDIVVVGNVEYGTLIAGRDLRVTGGIIGSTAIQCGRHCIVHHLQNAAIEAQGDVTILNSSMLSVVLSSGRIAMSENKGCVVGGSLCALKEIEVLSAGSTSGSKTELSAGNDYLVNKKIVECRKNIELYKESLKKIDVILNPILDIIRKDIPLDNEKKIRLKMIIDKRKQILKSLQIKQHLFQELERMLVKNRQATIIVRENLYTDVIIKIGAVMMKTDKKERNVKISLDNKTSSLRFGSTK